RSTLQRRSTNRRPSPWRNRSSCKKFRKLSWGAVDHRHTVHVAVGPEDDTPLSCTKPRRILKKRREYCLKIERRAADDLEDLRGSRLLIERFGEIAIARLKLLEQ